jgi:hypothetical protein
MDTSQRKGAALAGDPSAIDTEICLSDSDLDGKWHNSNTA